MQGVSWLIAYAKHSGVAYAMDIGVRLVIVC
jgi:hypothetical protein